MENDITQDLRPIFLHKGGPLEKPLTNKWAIRLYGHPLCPFVEKTRLALGAKNISYQFVIIDQNETGRKWHQDINGGLVPLLELPDG